MVDTVDRQWQYFEVGDGRFTTVEDAPNRWDRMAEWGAALNGDANLDLRYVPPLPRVRGTPPRWSSLGEGPAMAAGTTGPADWDALLLLCVVLCRLTDVNDVQTVADGLCYHLTMHLAFPDVMVLVRLWLQLCLDAADDGALPDPDTAIRRRIGVLMPTEAAIPAFSLMPENL